MKISDQILRVLFVKNNESKIQDKILLIVNSILNNPKNFLRVIRKIQIVIGLGLVIASSYFGWKTIYLLSQGTPAKGTIVDFKKVYFNNRSRNNNAFMPIVEFKVNDQVVRFQDNLGSGSPIGQGDLKDILYDSSNPEYAMIKRPIMNWIPWAPMFAVGLFLLIAALKKRTKSNSFNV